MLTAFNKTRTGIYFVKITQKKALAYASAFFNVFAKRNRPKKGASSGGAKR